MNKDKILIEIKNDLKIIIDEIRYDNLPSTQKQLEAYFNMIRGIGSPDILEHNQPNEDQKEETDDFTEEDIGENTETNSTRSVGIYKFRRKLRGGTLNYNIYITEDIVNKLDINNGDMVSASITGYHEDNEPKYYFEIAERTIRKEEDGISVFVDGILEYQDDISSYIVEKNIHGKLLKVDGIPTTKIISDEEVRIKNAKSGDIVDIAWYTTNTTDSPKIRRLIVTENIRDIEPTISELIRKGKTTTNTIRKNIPKTLYGKEILLIGMSPSESDMREDIEKYGGKLSYTEGNEGKDRLRKKISKFDLVVVAINHCSHKASTTAFACAKKLGVRITSISSYGRTGFIRTIHEAFEIDLEHDESLV